jgi:hypothetical protein
VAPHHPILLQENRWNSSVTGLRMLWIPRSLAQICSVSRVTFRIICRNSSELAGSSSRHTDDQALVRRLDQFRRQSGHSLI